MTIRIISECFLHQRRTNKMIDIKEIEKEMGLTDEDNQLLIIYKGKNVSSHITGMINRSGMTDKIVNRKMIFDVVGDYSVLYTDQTNIETICDGLLREVMGVSLKELGDQRREYLK